MTKRILMYVSAMIITFTTFAAEIKTEAKISEVVVYLQGATIFANTKVQIPQGVTQVVITKQSAQMDANSVQISGKGNFTILGVFSQINYLDKQKKLEVIENLDINCKSIQLQIDNLTNEIFAYNTEEKLLETNMNLKGENANLSVLELEKAANFYRNRIIEIRKKKLDASEQIKALQIKLSDIKNQLGKLKSNLDIPTGEILVTVSSKIAQTIELAASYFILDANWVPTYDFRVNDVNSPVKVQYKAIIGQNSGIPWENIKVTLSTGNPSLGGTAPTLYKWLLVRQDQEQYSMKKSYAVRNSANVVLEDREEAMPLIGYDGTSAVTIDELPKSKITSSYTTHKMTTVEFEIDEAISIISNNNEAYVTINEYNIPSQYQYVCVPKLDKDAFLTANITDYEKYNFLSGNANLYFEGAYVGNSFVDLERAMDTLSVSLGRDKGVVVERKLVSDFKEKKLLGNKRKEVYAWDIIVKNNKPNAIQIKIIDQIPVSGQSEIEVSNITYPEAVLKKETNNIYWQFSLDKQATKKLQFTYDISYPKEWQVNTK